MGCQLIHVSQLRLPRWMLVMEPGGTSSFRLPLHEALTPGIERVAFNSRNWVNAITVDLDGPAAAEFQWEESGLPPPTVSIRNRRGRREGRHDTWFLSTPVFRLDGLGARPTNFARIVRRGMTLRLGGDLHYANLLSKNPCHWKFAAFCPDNYSTDRLYVHSLEDLADQLDLDEAVKSLNTQSRENAHLNELARNDSLFNAGRMYAYRLGESYNVDLLSSYIVELNSGFARPLAVGEIRSITKSIDRYMKEAPGDRSREAGGRRKTPQIARVWAKISAERRRKNSRGFDIAARLAAGQSREEIAAAYGMTIGAVKQAGRRARRWLECVDKGGTDTQIIGTEADLLHSSAE